MSSGLFPNICVFIALCCWCLVSCTMSVFAFSSELRAQVWCSIAFAGNVWSCHAIFDVKINITHASADDIIFRLRNPLAGFINLCSPDNAESSLSVPQRMSLPLVRVQRHVTATLHSNLSPPSLRFARTRFTQPCIVTSCGLKLSFRHS